MPDAKWYADYIRCEPAESEAEKVRLIEAAEMLETQAAKIHELTAKLDSVTLERDTAYRYIGKSCKAIDAPMPCVGDCGPWCDGFPAFFREPCAENGWVKITDK